MDTKINNQGQARIFKNNFFEVLSKTHPWVIYSIYIPLSAYLLYYSYEYAGFSVKLISGLFFTALFSWTLFEYIAHRYLFHLRPKTALGERIIYIVHGNHHEFPRDRQRLFMPPIPSLLLAGTIFSIFFAISYLLTGTGNYALVFFPGFITGYLIYVSLHYAIHSMPPPKFIKGLWRHHHMHHYKYPEKAFGVSSPVWDKVFGTAVPREHKQKA